MNTASVVIGAGFGDEGKGMAVDALASTMRNPLVVRHNGGAQAGHTVQLPDGRRHVFSHFGAGTLAGAPTFLSRHFVVAPTEFRKELLELQGLGITPVVFADPDAMVTTPYDVLVNRWVEHHRGAGRHGSCGIGFGETIERHTTARPLRVRDLADEARLGEILNWQRDVYVPDRLERLGVPLTPETRGELNRAGRPYGFLADAELFLDRVTPMALADLPRDHRIIFEGAQGLLLDQRRGMEFPYVTRSNTGLQNVVELAPQLGVTMLEVYYMTRPYLTRHGAGPLPGETRELPGFTIRDPTNQPSPWQGVMRFAPLDPTLLSDMIAQDLRDACSMTRDIVITAGLGVSCVDQIDDPVERARTPAGLARRVRLPLVLTGHGPSRDTTDIMIRKAA